MKPIFVCVHVYYTEMWNELSSCIKNITVPFDLVITMVKRDVAFENMVKKDFPNAKILVVENRGFDVGPFIQVLNETNLDNYSYIIKLHSKRNFECYILNGYNMGGARWRKYLLDFISSKRNFNTILNVFSHNNKVGMVSNHKVIKKDKKISICVKEKCIELSQKMNLPLTKFEYVCGTMFMVRADLFNVLKKLNISINDFEIPRSHRDGQLAHVFERMFGFIVLAQGYNISDAFTPKYIQFFERIFFRFFNFLFLYKITSNGKLLIKICKIPVFNKTLKGTK